jgi:hypothetical protein
VVVAVDLHTLDILGIYGLITYGKRISGTGYW